MNQEWTGLLVCAAFPMHGHSIAMQPHQRPNSCWLHCTYLACKHHLYNTYCFPETWGVPRRHYVARVGIFVPQISQGGTTALSMDLLSSVERLKLQY